MNEFLLLELYNQLTPKQRIIMEAYILYITFADIKLITEVANSIGNGFKFTPSDIQSELKVIPQELWRRNGNGDYSARKELILLKFEELYDPTSEADSIIVRSYTESRYYIISGTKEFRDFLIAATTNNSAAINKILKSFYFAQSYLYPLIPTFILYGRYWNTLEYFPSAVLKESVENMIERVNNALAPLNQLHETLCKVAASTQHAEFVAAATAVELQLLVNCGDTERAMALVATNKPLTKKPYYPLLLQLAAGSVTDNAIAVALGKSVFVKKTQMFSSQNFLLKFILTVVAVQNSKENTKLLEKMDSYFASIGNVADMPFHILVLKSMNRQTLLMDKLEALVSLTQVNKSNPALIQAAFAAYFTDTTLPETDEAAYLKLPHLLQENGYLLLAAELSDILTKLFPNSDEAQSTNNTITALVNRPTFASQIVEKKAWEYALEQMMALSTSNVKEPAKQQEPEDRIAYLINFDHAYIHPVLQKYKKGVWNKGRAIALKRLKNEFIEGMTPQDVRISATIEEHQTYYSSQFDFNKTKALKEMVGHPYIFDEAAPTIPVELVNRKPMLVVKKQAKGYVLSFDIAISNDSYELVKETNTRYALVEFDTRIHRISRAIGSKPLTIPTEGEGLLKELIGKLSRDITIHSDFTNQDVAQLPADTNLYLLLMPVGDSLKAEILVKPLTDRPPYSHPGMGISHINTTTSTGETVQVVRNLKAEKQQAALLMEAIEHLSTEMEDEFTLIFGEPSDCLMLLEVLQQHKELCTVEWPEGVQFRLRRQVGMSNFGLSATQKGQWFELEGTLQVDENTVVTLQELLKMRRTNNRRFVEMADGEFLALSETLRKRIDEIQSAFTDSSSNRVSQFAIPQILEDADQYGSFKANKKALDFRKKIEEADKMTITIPKSLTAELRPYQEDGFRWMAKFTEWGAGACLADDMGLGKTIQSITLLLHRAAKGASLVVCPASVLPNWVAELQRFAPALTPVILSSTNREEAVKGALAFDVVITTYGLLQSEEALFQSVEWNCLIFDEAHILKNHQTKTHQAAIQVQAQCRIALTGTPVQNHLGELWSIFNLLNPGLLGKYSNFTSTFALPISQNADAHQRGILKRRISPFILRRTKSTVLDELPAKTEITLSVSLSNDEMTFYEAVRREAVENILSTKDAGQKHIRALAELTRLRLASCNTRMVNPEMVLPSSKLDAFASLVDELIENNHRSLVFSQFTKHLDLIREKLDEKGIAYQYLDGSTPIPERAERVREFQQGSDPLFLISLKAGGLGLNLTAADYVIHLDPWWNPAIEDQATDRAHRIGQQRPVTVYRLVAENTIEEKIVRLHQTKRELAEGLLEGADTSAKMSAEEMLNLLM